MLQDLAAGRPMELGALVAAVVELAERLSLSMQYTGTVYSCVKLLAQRSAPPATAPK
jgi:ketopantoate reductase